VKPRTLLALLSFFILVLTSIELAAAGQTYYVTTTGIDSNPGTESLPFRTVNKGVGVLKPGDKLYVKNGTYSEALVNNIPGGTSWDDAVTVAAFPGHAAIIKAPVGSVQALSFAGTTQRYIVIDGFVIDGINTQDQVIKIAQDHIRLQNTEIKNLSQRGIGIRVIAGDSTGAIGCCNEFINLNLHDDRDDPETKDTVGILIESAGNLVERSKIHSNWGDGILLWNDDFTSSNNNVIRKNKILNNGMGGNGDGLAIGQGVSNMVYNNLIVANRGGFSVGHQSSDVKIYNNTLYGNHDFGILLDSANSDSFTEVKNNIFYKNGSNIVDSATNTVLSNNLEAEPSFVDTAKGDFRLKSTSVAIDAGIPVAEVQDDHNGVARPQGLALDVGAFEFVDTRTTETKVPIDAAAGTNTISTTVPFDFSVMNSGDKSVIRGQSVSNDISATLSSGSSQAVSFSTSGLPTGATASFTSSGSCIPPCSRTLTIATSDSTPTGTHTITMTAAGGGVTKTTTFTLTINTPTAAAGVLSLTWNDNSTNESGFAIERKTGTTDVYTQIATVGSNLNSYVDTAVVAGVTYCYRVNAFNSAGASTYTTEACKAANPVSN
jgi:hypothetical protein